MVFHQAEHSLIVIYCVFGSEGDQNASIAVRFDNSFIILNLKDIVRVVEELIDTIRETFIL